MRDQFDRKINYMRISITDRCNFSCCYCCTDEKKVLCQEILRYEEIYQIVQAAVKIGITHFRVTGGEPFARKDCMNFLKHLIAIEGVETVDVTTNGSLLSKEQIQELQRMGLHSINISLDTLDERHFQEITGNNKFAKVKENILECIQCGLNVKINAVWGFQKDENDIWNLMNMARMYDVSVRFIEEMPMGTKRVRNDEQKVRICELLKKRDLSYQALENRNHKIGYGPAFYIKPDGFKGQIGFIEPMHNKFCMYCNRLRLTAKGELRFCLYYPDAIDIKSMIRKENENRDKVNEMEILLREAVKRKPMGHDFEKTPSMEEMYMIGG